MFFRVQVFWVHVFQGPGLSGSGSRVRVQVLEVALRIYMEIPLWHRCCPANLLPISEHLFIRTPLSDCFCMLKLWFHCFCITEAATRISSTKKLHCIFTQKLLEEVQVLVVLLLVSLQIYQTELLYMYFSIILTTHLPS